MTSKSLQCYWVSYLKEVNLDALLVTVKREGVQGVLPNTHHHSDHLLTKRSLRTESNLQGCNTHLGFVCVGWGGGS